MKGVPVAGTVIFSIIVLCSQIIIMSDFISSHIRLVSYNTRGLRSLTIPSLFDAYDIILLQETLLCKQDLGLLNTLSPEFQGTGVAVTDISLGIHKGRPSGGCALLWRKTLASIIKEIDFDLDWLTAISINSPNHEILYIITVYLPYQSNNNEEEFLSKLGILFSIMNDLESDNIMVLGDFNAHLGLNPSRFGNFLSESCIENNYLISSKLLLPSDSHTYISERWGSTSWLDHCISTERAHDLIVDMKIEYNLAAGYHIPFGCNLNLNLSAEFIPVNNARPVSSIKWDKLSDHEISTYGQNLDKLLNDIFTPTEKLNCRDFDCKNPNHIREQSKLYESILRAIKQASFHLSCKPRGSKRVIPGWNEYVKGAHTDSISATREWRENGLPTTGPIFEHKVQSHRAYKLALRKAKRNEKFILGKKLANNLTVHNGREFWKDIRKVTGKTKSSPICIDGTSGDPEICKLWKSHYEGILNCLEGRNYDIDCVNFNASVIVTAAEVHDYIGGMNAFIN